MIEKWELTIPALSGSVPRRAYVYTPDSLQEDPDRRYPVLYMFDGHNVFFDEDATYGKSWGMLEYLDYTQTQIIVAAVECDRSPGNGRLEEYSPFTCFMEGTGRIRGRGRTTMAWFVNEFKPYIDENFPTLPDRDHTFIAGSSMGGLMSLYALIRYNKVFSRAAALSPSIWFGTDKLEQLLRTAHIRRGTVLYMDYGARELRNHDDMLRKFGEVTALLMERKVLVNSRIVPNGDHSEASWEKQVPFFMDTLLYDLD